MNVIGLVTLHVVLGEGLRKLGNEAFYNFTINEITRKIEREGLIKDKCALNTIEEAINQFGRTYIFISDDYYHEKLLRILLDNFVHSYYTEPESLSYFDPDSFESFVIFRNKIELREVLKRKPLQNTYFFIYVRNHQEAVNAFEILWENRLVNVVATYIVNMTAYYYTYFPYCSKHCGRVGTPHLLAQCDITTGIFSRKQKLFPRKVYNLHKCPVTATFMENIPASYYNENNELTGWEIELLNAILERVNGVPQYTFLKNRKRAYRRADGYHSLVENSEVGGGLVASLRGLVKTDFCMYGLTLCSTWVVPRNEEAPRSADFLVKVFPPSVWLMVFVTYFSVAALIVTFSKLKLGNVLFKLLPFLLGTTTRTRKTSKILGGLWLSFCLIINAIYQSRYQSTLVVPSIPKQFSCTSQILKSDLKILGRSDLLTETLPYFKSRFNLTGRRYRRSRKDTPEELVYRLTVRKDSAYLGYKETIHYNIDRTQLSNKVYILDHCVIKYHLAFVLKKNSHLTDTFIKLSNKLNENGFLVYFVRKHLSRESRQHIPKKLKQLLKPLSGADCDKTTPPIGMDQMFVVFMCLAGGISLAFVAFIFELMSTCDCSKLKKRILRELHSAWSYSN